jgi:hypothetical protein
VAKAVLSKYSTLYVEDEKLLGESVWMTQNQKNCIRVRMGEKRVVHAVYELA